MRDEYDFSNAIKNPYVAKNKQQITIRLDQQVIDYFKNSSKIVVTVGRVGKDVLVY